MASAPINKVQDKNGDQFFPITHQQAVINDDGDNLVTIIGGLLPKTGGVLSNTLRIETPTSEGLVVYRNGQYGAYVDYCPAGQDVTRWRVGANTGAVFAFYRSVNGGASIDQKASIDSSGNFAATGTITPGSDARIKDNQKDILPEEAMDVVSRLKPKTWDWAEKTGNIGSSAGLVAQDVLAVIPDAVIIGDGFDLKDFHSLNYNAIQGYEIAAIKGLIEEVKALRAELAELKKTR